MTLQEMVEDYVGTFPDTGAVDRWLEVGVRKVYDLVPLRFLERITTPVGVPYSGLALSACRLSTVVSGGVTLIQIPLSYKDRARDRRSIHYATPKEPVCYIENGSLHVLPRESALSATAYVVEYPTVTHLSSTLGAYVHREVEQALVLYVAIQCRMRQLSDVFSVPLSLPSRTLPTAPSAPLLSPSVTEDPALAETVVESVILSLPEFPLFVMETIPIDLTLPAESTLVPPPAPELDDLALSGGLVPPPPEPLDLTGVLASLAAAMSQEDLELATGRMNEVRTRLEAHYGAYESYLKGLQAASEVERSAVEKRVAEYRARVDAFTAEMNGYVSQIRIGLDYHAARASVTKTAVDAAVAKYTGEIEGTLAVWRGKIEAFAASVNAAMQKASLAQARLVELARLEHDGGMRRAQLEAERQVNEYRLALERYGSEVSAYAGGVQADAAGIVALIQQKKATFDGLAAGLQELKAQYTECITQLSRRAA